MKTNAFAVEKSAGLPEDAVRSILRGTKKAGTTLNKAQAVCDALGLELYIGPPRQTVPVDAVDLDGEPFILVPRLDVRLSAGPGAQNHYPDELGRLAFRRDWLASLVARFSDAVLVQVAGDSMAPGLRDGDLALVDTGRQMVRSGAVYAFTDLDGTTRVKRVDTVPKSGFILRSDAPDHPAEVRFGADAELIEIHGQVVWSGHVWERS